MYTLSKIPSNPKARYVSFLFQKMCNRGTFLAKSICEVFIAMLYTRAYSYLFLMFYKGQFNQLFECVTINMIMRQYILLIK